jgi:aminoglycoside 6'-N-acetyltransferase
MDQYIFSAAGKAFGYLQCYDLTAWNAGFGPQPAGTCGIDLLIGEPNLIERGHGSALLRAFADRLLRNGAPRIVTDPDPENGRAVRAYQKAGFEKDRMVDTPDGPALLMVRNTWRRAYRPDPAADRLVIRYRLSSQHFNLARAHDRLLPP